MGAGWRGFSPGWAGSWAMEIWQPTMGWTPASFAVTENSSAANMLLVSVTATAGMFCAVQRPTSFFTGTAPSRSECSVWVRRWMNGDVRRAWGRVTRPGASCEGHEEGRQAVTDDIISVGSGAVAARSGEKASTMITRPCRRLKTAVKSLQLGFHHHQEDDGELDVWA